MALSDTILSPKQVILISTNAPIGVSGVGGDFAWGLVARVYETSDRTTVGQLVLYNQKRTSTLILDSVTYLMVSEEDLRLNQNYSPPL